MVKFVLYNARLIFVENDYCWSGGGVTIPDAKLFTKTTVIQELFTAPSNGFEEHGCGWGGRRVRLLP
jgi:hypothetical protein